MQTPKRMDRSPFLRILLVVYSIIVLAIVSGCGTTMHLQSHWPDKEVVVDGNNTEWDRTYLIDDNKLVIAFVNDSDFVYVLLATNDRPLARSMIRGLTVWFDPKGGTDKTFGIHYPMGRMLSRGDQRGENQDDVPMLESTDEFSSLPTELEILGPGKNDRHRMQIMETGGIQAKYKFTGNSLVYELRVPYAEGEKYPFSIRTNPGTVVGLGLETSQGRIQRRGGESGVEKAEGESQNGGDEGGYGGGMRGEGRGGQRTGVGQGGDRNAQGSLDIWMIVKLVTNVSENSGTGK